MSTQAACLPPFHTLNSQGTCHYARHRRPQAAHRAHPGRANRAPQAPPNRSSSHRTGTSSLSRRRGRHTARRATTRGTRRSAAAATGGAGRGVACEFESRETSGWKTTVLEGEYCAVSGRRVGKSARKQGMPRCMGRRLVLRLKDLRILPQGVSSLQSTVIASACGLGPSSRCDAAMRAFLCSAECQPPGQVGRSDRGMRHSTKARSTLDIRNTAVALARLGCKRALRVYRDGQSQRTWATCASGDVCGLECCASCLFSCCLT